MVWSGLRLLIAGTGGIFASENVEQLSNWIAKPPIEVRHSSQNRPVDSRTVRDHLLNVRTTFRLNMTELAQVFGVTRPATYGWLEGTEPKPEAQRLILQLSGAADRLARSDIERPELYVRRPMFNGKSLVDLLKAGRSVAGALASIETLAKKEAATRKEAQNRRVGQPKQQLEHLATLATPLMPDSDS
jgi:hypothetical protein